MRETVVTIFGSSKPKPGEPAYENAQRLGRLLAESGFTVCNGGYGGIMEATARGAREAGGKTIGVTTEEFPDARVNSWITEERKMKSWRERLFQLIDLGSGYVVLDGGTGTLAEFAVVWEMSRRNLIPPKPIVLLGKFWQKALESLRENREIESAPSFHLASNSSQAVSKLKTALCL